MQGPLEARGIWAGPDRQPLASVRDNVQLHHDSLIDSHAGELDPAYQWLREIADPVMRADAAAVIDIALSEQLALPRVPLPPDCARWLRLALERAVDRKCRRVLLDHLALWLPQITAPSRVAFLEGLPQLAPAVADLSGDGIGQVIRAVNRDPRLMPCIYAFANTTPEIVRSVAHLAAAADVAAMQRLVVLFPYSRVEEDREAERLLELLGALPRALPLLLTIAQHNVSSAYGAARNLRGKELAPDYLALFQDVVEATGTRAIDWCLFKLPELVRRNQAGPVVATAVQTARQYGVLAAEAFLQGRTRAARSLTS